MMTGTKSRCNRSTETAPLPPSPVEVNYQVRYHTEGGKTGREDGHTEKQRSEPGFAAQQRESCIDTYRDGAGTLEPRRGERSRELVETHT